MEWNRRRRLEVLFGSSSTDYQERTMVIVMIRLEKQFIEGFRSASGLRYEVFQLDGTENMMKWTNLAKTMSANQDEEIWVEQVHYRDSKQRDEFMAMCGKDENMTRLFKQIIDLVTPGSTITGELNRLEL
jgi:hypothetical protein